MLTRAEIRAQMVAIKNSLHTMHNATQAYGLSFPQSAQTDEGRLSTMSRTMSRQVKRTVKGERSSVLSSASQGPHIAGYGIEKQHMPVVTNDAHCANTNNGYSRKPNGGFYYH